MALFKRPDKGRELVPIATYLDDAWFATYWKSIELESGVNVDDQDLFQLSWMTLDIIDDWASRAFAHMGDLSASTAYEQLKASSTASAPIRCGALASWDGNAVPLLAERLESMREIIVGAGQRYGKFRFHPSPCCGEPIEMDFSAGVLICTSCKKLQE